MSTLDASMGAASRAAPARPWTMALGLAAAALYLPQLIPLATSDILDHPHCLGIYWRGFPYLTGFGPGVHARIASGLGEPGEEVVFHLAAIAVALLLLGGGTLAMRRWRRGGWAALGVVALLSAFLSHAAVGLIRM